MNGGVTITGPGWLEELPLPGLGPAASDETRAAWVLDLLERQVREATGGPFAAAVFSDLTGELLSAAVNRVEPTATAIAHAEVLALAQAGQAVGSFSLDGHDAVLVTSTEPCAMCLGAVGWSGVRRLVCCATDADARSIGFDEGDKLPDWRAALERRGVAVVSGVGRDRAVAAMRRYVEQGGVVYNPGRA